MINGAEGEHMRLIVSNHRTLSPQIPLSIRLTAVECEFSGDLEIFKGDSFWVDFQEELKGFAMGSGHRFISAERSGHVMVCFDVLLAAYPEDITAFAQKILGHMLYRSGFSISNGKARLKSNVEGLYTEIEVECRSKVKHSWET